MAIKGLTDRGLSFPEIGHIRKGAKVEGTRRDGSKYERPIDLEYFRVEFAEEEQEAEETFKNTYGDKPTEIRIILPFNEIERMWDPFLEAYVASRMMARSDGENVLYLVNKDTGEVLVKNGIDLKTGKNYPHPENNLAAPGIKFAPTGRLKVIVPELARAAYLTVHTTSYIDVANISQQLNAFSVLNNGKIAGIPFMLRRRPKQISVPDKDGKRVRLTKWMLSIEADPQWVKAKLSEVKRLALPGNGLNLFPQLEPGKPTPETTEDEPEEVEGEWNEEFFDENQPEEEQAEEVVTEQPTATMDIETAKAVKTKDGIAYGDLDDDSLQTVIDGITNALNSPTKMTPARREDLQFKLDAAKTVLANT